MFHLFLLFCCCSHLYHKYIPTKRICQYQITRKIKKNKEKLQFYIVFTCFSYVSLFFIIIFLAQNPNFPLACMLSAAGMVLSSSSVINHYPCVVFIIHFFAHNIHARDKICNILQGKKQKKDSKLYKKMGLLQNCFPVSAATVLINISLKTIHASGFRCAPEERGITAYGLAHRLWIYPRFCAL